MPTYPAGHILEVTTLVVDAVLVLRILQKLDFLQDVLPFLHSTVHHFQHSRARSQHVCTYKHTSHTVHANIQHTRTRRKP